MYMLQQLAHSVQGGGGRLLQDGAHHDILELSQEKWCRSSKVFLAQWLISSSVKHSLERYSHTVFLELHFLILTTGALPGGNVALQKKNIFEAGCVASRLRADEPNYFLSPGES